MIDPEMIFFLAIKRLIFSGTGQLGTFIFRTLIKRKTNKTFAAGIIAQVVKKGAIIPNYLDYFSCASFHYFSHGRFMTE